jgi:hypothetical protein
VGGFGVGGVEGVVSNEAIVEAAYAVARGELWEPKDRNGEPLAGYCLAQTRVIVERAFRMRSHQWYEDYVTEWVQPAGYDRSLGHWARDAERSLRNLGMQVDFLKREPGDLVFNWESAYSNTWKAYIGHVGVLVHGDLVLENIHPAFRAGRGFMKGTTGLTPVHAWKQVTSVIRFRPRDIVI